MTSARRSNSRAPGDERDHDLGHDRLAGLAAGVDGGLENGARLHLGDFGIADGEAAAAEAEHGVELVQLGHAVLELLQRHAERLRDGGGLLVVVRQEFVQRRVEQADGDGQAAHDLEQGFEIGALHGQDFRERAAAPLLVVGADHLAHGQDAVGLEEHVLGAAEADALGAELARLARHRAACRRWRGP